MRFKELAFGILAAVGIGSAPATASCTDYFEDRRFSPVVPFGAAKLMWVRVACPLLYWHKITAIFRF